MTAEPLVVDTNVLIPHWNGDPRTTSILDGAVLHASFITEIKVLGFHGYTDAERSKVAKDLQGIRIIDLENGIKSEAIRLRSTYRLRLADALVAATAAVLNIPLVTEDKHFRKLKEEIALHMLEGR